MIGVKEEMRKRLEDVDRFLRFLSELDAEKWVFKPKPDSGVTAPSAGDFQDWMKIQKASAYLLIYSMVESTMVSIVETIFQELRVRQTSWDSCEECVQRIVLVNFRRHNVDKIHQSLNSIATDIIFETFVKDEVFSGNVDGRKIRKTAEKWGFDPPSGDSTKLLELKTARNDLAHGTKSFSELGRDASVGSLKEFRDQAKEVLEKTIENVEAYIRDEKYLRESERRAAI